MRIVIAEDQLILRQGLTALLAPLGITTVAAEPDAERALRACAALQPDLALLDIRMPPTHRDEGLRAALELRATTPGFPVMLLSQYVEHLYVQELLDSPGGGVGYLLKDRVFDDARFASQLRSVSAGGTVMDPEVVANLMSRRDTSARLAPLTPRELEVLGLMAQGRGNQQMAEELVVTLKAVAKHINAIFTKLGLPAGAPEDRRVAAVLEYLRSGS
ncbi:response regulator transcription factor [Galactobacter caseinivorans]|uniref:DNA-binding response regulator n=1 Tax=Galactobacter caseinivorans TaxID=2676123 RepID=A0A496PMZ5_9MICC|nr:response regulator transcription factor [Galactobacter caseinivorans]RKW71905.1 DNA-binding response regulator [Galactobacter caseinivorans]